jgi:hypothetical protein
VKLYVNLQVFRDFRKVRFYTFQFEEDNISETAKFFDKLKTIESITDDLNRVAQWIVEIGQNHGALIELFRFEEEAYALPPPPKGQRKVGITQIEHNDIRLYCVWISESIVILANGGIKKSATTQGTPELMPHFRFAKSMGRQINQLMTEGLFQFRGKEIIDTEQIDLFIS